jgi:hypothetical protein
LEGQSGKEYWFFTFSEIIFPLHWLRDSNGNPFLGGKREEKDWNENQVVARPEG